MAWLRGRVSYPHFNLFLLPLLLQKLSHSVCPDASILPDAVSATWEYLITLLLAGLADDADLGGVGCYETAAVGRHNGGLFQDIRL